MKVLVIGSGGREHTLVWKLAQSPRVSEILCMEGNPGMAPLARLVPTPSGGVDAMAAWARDEGIDLAVVGPEAPLAAGVVDAFHARGVRIVGPTKRAAEIESSKVFSKELMAQAGVPTARFIVCETPKAARAAVRRLGAPVVVKADGLAAGKGVIVAASVAEADRAIEDLMVEQIFGAAGNRLIIEEFLVGTEASILSFVDGEHAVPLIAAKDHKPVGDGNTGPNTGGMGAFAPVPAVDGPLMHLVAEQVFAPVVKAMEQCGRPYRGVLYAGLMLTERGPYVIEFNSRLGDPETQVIVPLLESDIVPPLLATIDGTINEIDLTWKKGAAVCVIAASEGYPGALKTGHPISGVDEAGAMEDIILFHSATASRGEQLVTDGGRVMGVTALGATLPQAAKKAYEAMGSIHFKGMHYRRDIAVEESSSGVT